MHERSIASALLRQIEVLKSERNAVCARLRAVHVSIGEFSGVEPTLLCSAFEEVVASSADSGAQLALQVVPIAAECLACASEFEVKNFEFRCPACQANRINIVRGEGIVLESITLEEDDG